MKPGKSCGILFRCREFHEQRNVGRGEKRGKRAYCWLLRIYIYVCETSMSGPLTFGSQLAGNMTADPAESLEYPVAWINLSKKVCSL